MNKVPICLYSHCLPNWVWGTSQCEVFSKKDVIKGNIVSPPKQTSSLQKGVGQRGQSCCHHTRFPPKPLDHCSDLLFHLLTPPQSFLQSINSKDDLKYYKKQAPRQYTNENTIGENTTNRGATILLLAVFHVFDQHWLSIYHMPNPSEWWGEGLSVEVNFSTVMK